MYNYRITFSDGWQFYTSADSFFEVMQKIDCSEAVSYVRWKRGN